MAAELVDRLAILVAIRRFHGMGASFWGDVRLEFMQHLFLGERILPSLKTVKRSKVLLKYY
jgi:hypothetical protein